MSVIADGCVDDGQLAVFTGSCVGEVALAIVPGGQLVKAVKVAKTIVVKAVGTTKGVIIKPEAQKKIWQNKKKKDKKKKDEKFECHSSSGGPTREFETKLQTQINKRWDLEEVHNAVVNGNKRYQDEIVYRLVKEIGDENQKLLNLWTSDIAGSHVQRCYNKKTLESWTATKDLIELQNLITETMKKHCSDFEEKNKMMPAKMWEGFGSMWDKCSKEFVKNVMKNTEDFDLRDRKNRRVYKLDFTYPADKPSHVLLSDTKTFWRSELPEIFAHLCESNDAKVLIVTIISVHRGYSDTSMMFEFKDKILTYLGNSSKKRL